MYPALTFPAPPSTLSPDGKTRIDFDEVSRKALVDLSFLDDLVKYENAVEAQRKIYEVWKKAHKVE